MAAVTQFAQAGARREIAVAYGAAVVLVAWWPSRVDRPYGEGLHQALSVLHAAGIAGWLDYAATERLANVVLFLPVGWLVAAFLGTRRGWAETILAGTAAGVALSLVLEFVQSALLTDRVGSIADVLANACGAAVGAALVAVSDARARGRSAMPSGAAGARGGSSRRR
ncbi:VanZ family protein [Agromyces sp. LHK192]|uniref:VanZ family protein n=1 Tax=Agromyces sp. LHK192 TaxID=2498704 RepID=UPI000FDC2ED1|nr:VanZ family protein [Agromyces sp. LHK192]